VILSQNSKGFLEDISWKAILLAIATFLVVFFGFPEYVLNVRPKLEKAIGNSVLSFIEGAITGTLLTVLVLKFLAERCKKQKTQQLEKIASKDLNVF
jgi:hypothetical protein